MDKIDEICAADLVDMQKVSRDNEGFNFFSDFQIHVYFKIKLNTDVRVIFTLRGRNTNSITLIYGNPPIAKKQFKKYRRLESSYIKVKQDSIFKISRLNNIISTCK